MEDEYRLVEAAKRRSYGQGEIEPKTYDGEYGLVDKLRDDSRSLGE